MNQTRLRQPRLCSSARDHSQRRKPPELPWCAADCHHLPRTRSWADAATSTQLDTIPAHARAKGVSALPKISNPLGKDKPRIVTGSYQLVPAPVAAATWGHPGTLLLVRTAYAGARGTVTGLLRLRATVRAGWRPDLLQRFGGRVFAGNDREAGWRSWSIERRRAGLSRLYRDPMFDRLVRCRHCRGAGTAAAGTVCAPCSGTGRLVLDQPPIAHDG